jgi:hypothetical protein
LDLLLKSNNGELTTSQITDRLSISQPIATKTMRELEALGIVYISTVSNYENSEYKIKLRSEFNWFKSAEFLKLKEEFIPAEEKEEFVPCSEEENDTDAQTDCIDEFNENTVTLEKDNDDLSNSSPNCRISSFIDNDSQDNNEKVDKEACDHKICHTLKQNLPSEQRLQEKNNGGDNQKVIKDLQQGINDHYSSDNFNAKDQLLQQNNTNLNLKNVINVTILKAI